MPLSRSLNGDFDYSQLKQNWMGEWNEGTIYKINDTVRINNTAFVMNSTYHSENNLFGQEVKPGVDTTNWTMIAGGIIYKGDWAYKDRHYVGDVVRFNGDFYQCTTNNFGGHPIYENGALTTKWIKIAQDSARDRSKKHLQFALYPPMGWTRNMCESNETGAPGYKEMQTINGNYELSFIGRDWSSLGKGLGERDNWYASDNSNASATYQYTKHGGFDFWDYIDGYRTSITGGAPKLIQLTGTSNFTFALFDNGELYHCGYGGHGQNGDGTTSDYKYFRRVGRSGARGTGVLRDVHIIKTGHSAKGPNSDELDTHSCFALDNTGRVWTWGYNGYGNLGHGNTSNYSTPTVIPQEYFHDKKIVDCWMSGYNYQSSYAQTEDGEIYSWGYNGYGQLGNGNYGGLYRPERVKYPWAKFGGLKKFIAQGHGSYGNAVALTNDGTVHMTGYFGQSGGSMYGMGNPNTTYVGVFSPMARLFEIRRNALGIGSKISQLTNLIDVSRNCEEFWVINRGGMASAIVMKEKGTGVMYMVGDNGYGQFATYRKHLNYDECVSDNPYNNPNTQTPVPIHMGNMTDVKYISKFGHDGYVALMYHNSDNRVWTGGGAGGNMHRGVGNNGGVDPTGQHIRGGNRLPWEHFQRSSYQPLQPRFHEPVSMICPLGGASESGFAFITSNNRYVNAHNVFSWYYGWDPASNPSQVGYGSFNYTRTDL